MRRHGLFSISGWTFGMLGILGCQHQAAAPLLTAQRVEIPLCVAPIAPREVPEKPDLPLNHLNEDMDAADILLAYRQSVVLLEGWGEALRSVLKDGYATSASTEGPP